MKHFTDKTGAVWEVSLNPTTCARVAQAFGRSLSVDLVTSIDGSTVGKFAWAIVGQDAEARGVCKGIFFDRLFGAPALEFMAAVLEELADFLPGDIQPAVTAGAANLRKMLADAPLELFKIELAGPAVAKHAAAFFEAQLKARGQVTDCDTLAVGHLIIAPPGQPIEQWAEAIGETGRRQVIEAVRKLVNRAA